MLNSSFPNWLHILSLVWIVLGVLCAVAIAVDEFRYPQKMWIMNLVWPLTALFGTVIWLAAYFAWGRHAPGSHRQRQPFAVMVTKGTSHCGAGCTLADIIVEWSAFAFPALAMSFGWHRIFSEKTFAVWIPDFIVAFLLGIAFQYFTIKPMRDLSVKDGIIAAIKADTLSLTAWQVGMYGWMALVTFAIFGHELDKGGPVFWFMMQVAMGAGFLTSYPVNWWLVRSGIKERM